MPTRIFIATHKPSPSPEDKGYIPIHVGKAISNLDLNIAGDNTGDNISTLNPFFCEMTGLYWIWKNALNTDAIGFAHYRRFFAPERKLAACDGREIAGSQDFSSVETPDIDMVVSAPMHMVCGPMPITVLQNYNGCHIGLDLYVTRQVIAAECPEYLHAFDYTMANTQLIPYNMFVAKSEMVKSYCEWVFHILFDLEKRIPYRTYDAYQQRVFGFIAERLFTTWITRHRYHYKIAYRPLVVF